MDDDEPVPPEADKPRFLLPDGCKDLIDVWQQKEKEPVADSRKRVTVYDGSGAKLKLVTLPNSLTVRELARAIHLSSYQVICSLVYLNILATVNTRLEFETMAKVCSLHGIAACPDSTGGDGQPFG